jgi:uncharacterized phage protein (TIGR02220 family)
MSLIAMTLVWQSYDRGGSEKLTLLALADWCDDHGGNLYPSIRTVARKICSSQDQTRRIVHSLIERGVLAVVGNHNGGHKSQTRQYRIDLEGLRAGVYATPCADVTPCIKAVDPLHGCSSPLAPMQANTLLNVKETSAKKNASKIAIEVLNYLNEKTGRSYRPVDSNMRLVKGRLEDGATIEDCKAVIDSKVAEWAEDKKMSKFLRPATLFNAEKFAQYVGEIDTPPADGGVQWE